MLVTKCRYFQLYMVVELESRAMDITDGSGFHLIVVDFTDGSGRALHLMEGSAFLVISALSSYAAHNLNCGSDLIVLVCQFVHLTGAQLEVDDGRCSAGSR